MITKQIDSKFTAKKKTVFVVDNHPIVRQGLTLLINQEPDLAVRGDAEEMHTALSAIVALNPDILIVDISLSGPDGLELLKHIRLRSPHPRSAHCGPVLTVTS